MSCKIKFYPNTKIEFFTKEGYAISNIQSLDSGSISVSVPVINSTYLTMKKGEEYEAIYSDLKNNIFKFTVKILDHKKDRIPLIITSEPYDIIKIQRRNYVRISQCVSVKYCLMKEIPDKDIKSYDASNFNFAYILDLSGGGAKIKLEEYAKVNDYVILHLDVDGTIIVLAKIVRVQQDKENHSICGVKFVNLDFNSREKIIQYIFKEMRRILKNSGGGNFEQRHR